MLDAVGLISDALEQLNIASDSESDEIELDLEKLGYALDAALTFLGNASTQTSNLRRVKLMEDINKELSHTPRIRRIISMHPSPDVIRQRIYEECDRTLGAS